MNVSKRLKLTHGATNAKLMAMTHPRTDVAKIEDFFAAIGCELALIICKSLRGVYSIHAIGKVAWARTRTIYAEILFWLMACYNNPMFAKTYHLGWKYGGYENHSLQKRSQLGRRFRNEMLAFMNYYTFGEETVDANKRGWSRYQLNSTLTFSFADTEPSSYWIWDNDPLAREISWRSIRGTFVARYPFPSYVTINPNEWAPQAEYSVVASYCEQNSVSTIVKRDHATPTEIRQFIDAEFHIKSI